MQAAKKQVLVDEFDREYKHLRRPADKVAKTDQSLQFSNTLRDQSIADNRKVRIRHGPAHVPEVRKEVPAESAVEPIPGTYTQNSPHHHPCEDDDTDDNVDPGPPIEMEHVAFAGQFRWRPQPSTLWQTIGARIE